MTKNKNILLFTSPHPVLPSVLFICSSYRRTSCRRRLPTLSITTDCSCSHPQQEIVKNSKVSWLEKIVNNRIIFCHLPLIDPQLLARPFAVARLPISNRPPGRTKLRICWLGLQLHDLWGGWIRSISLVVGEWSWHCAFNWAVCSGVGSIVIGLYAPACHTFQSIPYSAYAPLFDPSLSLCYFTFSPVKSYTILYVVLAWRAPVFCPSFSHF